MEITNNQPKTVALEGVAPDKVSAVTAVKNNVSQGVAQSYLQNTVLVGAGHNKEAIDSTGEAKKQQEQQDQAGNLQAAVSQINDHVQNLQRDLHFSVDEATGKDVVTVIDRESDTVVRQIPSEEALELARRLADNSDDRVQLFSTLA